MFVKTNLLFCFADMGYNIHTCANLRWRIPCDKKNTYSSFADRKKECVFIEGNIIDSSEAESNP